MSQSTLAHEQSMEKPARLKKKLDDYELLINENAKTKTSDLGKGSYGSVKKVRDKKTGETFAMKILTKKSIFQYATKENLKREINIQKSITHPNIVKLYHYFEDKENVYLILEYAENGSLFHYLRKKRTLAEQEAFIYFLQTCLGIDYLHKRKILHRDLKPENLLLNKDSNIKLCDFGWSAEITEKYRHTFCGTVDYMAPEMVKNQPYDHRLDIWCLGVLLYEILHGYAPFKGKSDNEKCRNIAQNASIEFNAEISKEAVDLVRKILKPKPADRLSMEEILKHPWMKKYEEFYNMSIHSLIREQDELVKDSQNAFQRAERAKAESRADLTSTKTEESFAYENDNGHTGKNGKGNIDYYSKTSKAAPSGEDTYAYAYYDKTKSYDAKSGAGNTKAKDPYSYDTGKEYKTNTQSQKSDDYRAHEKSQEKYNDYDKSYQKSSKADDPSSYYKKAAAAETNNPFMASKETINTYDSYASKSQEQNKSSQVTNNVFFKFLNTTNSTNTGASGTEDSYSNDIYTKKYTADFKNKTTDNAFTKFLNNPQAAEPTVSSPEKPKQKNPMSYASYEDTYNEYLREKAEREKERSKQKEELVKSSHYSPEKTALYEKKYSQAPIEEPDLQKTKSYQEKKPTQYTNEKPWQETKTYQENKPSPYKSDQPARQREYSPYKADNRSNSPYEYENMRQEDSSYRKPTLYVNQYQNNQEDVDNYFAKAGLLQKKPSIGFEELSNTNRSYDYSFHNDSMSRSRSYDDGGLKRKRSLEQGGRLKGEKEKRSRNVDRDEKYRAIEEEHDDYDESRNHRREEREQKGERRRKGRKKQRQTEPSSPNFIEKVLIRLGCITRTKEEY